MRVLVLHSDVAPDALPDELDTLVAAQAVAEALGKHGHVVTTAPFNSDPDRFELFLKGCHVDVVFNLVEGVDGLGQNAPIAPRLLDDLGATFTGVDAAAMATTNDKPLTKRRLRAAGIATPDWSEPPHWHGLTDGTYIVKSALEDASLGLDDLCVMTGAESVKRRAADCSDRLGGRWFAEQFIDGREFNISLLQGPEGPEVLPMAEMVFEKWPPDRPRIVGYRAKWDGESLESIRTVRHFGTEGNEPSLAAKLRRASLACWRLFDLSGYARIDFRVTADGEPLVLEINTNPGIAPDAGFAAAAAQAGLSYDALIARIIAAAGER